MSRAKRICVKCGSPFDGEKEQRLCPECRSASRSATVKRERTCQMCGALFLGGPRARYCPPCRAERERAHTREYQARKRAGKTRKLGSVDYCVECGKPYTVSGGLQRYCPDCAPVAVQETVNAHKREYAKGRLDISKARKAELSEAQMSICAYCGKPYKQQRQETYCSPECKRELNRISNAMSKYKAGKIKHPPRHDRAESGLPQSDLPGVHFLRRMGKWEVVIRGEYHGLYQTKESAEAGWAKYQPGTPGKEDNHDR